MKNFKLCKQKNKKYDASKYTKKIMNMHIENFAETFLSVRLSHNTYFEVKVSLS